MEPTKPKDDMEWFSLELEISGLFDGAPVSEEDLFAGRSTEVLRILKAVMERSKHVVLFGERGVGKTSLSNVFWKRFNAGLQSFLVARVQAGPHDNFTRLWLRALDELKAAGYAKSRSKYVDFETEFEELTPTIIRRELAKCGANSLPIIIIDEYNEIIDESAKILTANLIKELYDFSISTTVILVGVAENISELVEDHNSIGRAIIQIPLARMSESELREIINSRVGRTVMSFDVASIWTIIKLSKGLPYITHTMSKHAAMSAIKKQHLVVTNEDVDAAMDEFIADSETSFKDDYREATNSNQANNFKQSLLACALAKPDEEGFFTATDVVEPFSSIMKERKQIAHFDKHLRRFSGELGGNTLIKRGGERQQKFRFKDPMMQSYVIIRGIRDRMITDETRASLLQQEQPSLFH